MAVPRTGLHLDLASPRHRIFGFHDPSAALKDHRQLRVRERIARVEFGDFACVRNGFFEPAEFLKVDSQGHMRLLVVGGHGEDFQQSRHAALQVSLFLQAICRIVHRVRVLVGIRHISGRHEKEEEACWNSGQSRILVRKGLAYKARTADAAGFLTEGNCVRCLAASQARVPRGTSRRQEEYGVRREERFTEPLSPRGGGAANRRVSGYNSPSGTLCSETHSGKSRRFMDRKVSSNEAALLAVVFLAGVLLRVGVISRQAVEHFDEGIYSSVLWYDGAWGESWPSRALYAPPLLSGLISAIGWFSPLKPWAPFLPSIVLGSATIIALWWLVRSWFGAAAGLFAAAVIAGSDYHVLLSRMALTDVPCLLFMISAVGTGVRGIDRSCSKSMTLAGLFTGLAWWCKYTGWLPIAIVSSGSVLWWVLGGRRQVALTRLIAMNALMTGVAAAVWAPWLWALQSEGGYLAVAANHRGYVSGFANWQKCLTTQLAIQFTLDGFPAAVSMGSGLLIAGGHRWMVARRSTWNSAADPGVAGYPPYGTLVRFVLAAVACTTISLAIWTPLLLLLIAVGGMIGIFLWPVLSRQWAQAHGDTEGRPEQAPAALAVGERHVAPAVDPLLGLTTSVAWATGLLVVTPLYHPYPRLMLPLMTGVWVCAAGGVGWWIEANLGVARRTGRSTGVAAAPGFSTTGLLGVLLVIAVAISMVRASGNPVHSLLGESRRSLEVAAREVAVLCRKSSAGILSRTVPPLPEDGIIRPDEVEDRTAGADVHDAAELELPGEGEGKRPVVVYGFGEPALLFHLHSRGCLARPVAHLNLAVTPEQAERADSFLVIGPHAKRTPGFWDEWMRRESQFELIGEVDWYPSSIPLLNLFSPGWVGEHPEAQRQVFEVYRIRTRGPEAGQGG